MESGVTTQTNVRKRTWEFQSEIRDARVNETVEGSTDNCGEAAALSGKGGKLDASTKFSVRKIHEAT